MSSHVTMPAEICCPHGMLRCDKCKAVTEKLLAAAKVAYKCKYAGWGVCKRCTDMLAAAIEEAEKGS